MDSDMLKYLQAVFTVQSSPLSLFYKTSLAVLGALLAWFVIKRGVTILERRLSGNQFARQNHRVFQILRTAMAGALALLAGSYLIGLYQWQFLGKAFHAAIIIVLAKPVKDFVNVALAYMESNIAQKTESKVDDIIFDLLNKFSGVLIYAIGIVIALDMLGLNVMPFVAGAGVMGIAIGFAAKDTLSNLIAGVLLIIDRPFEIGDRIEVWSAPMGSATWGDVIDIGLRATKIKTTDNIVIIIPNNEIMKRDIVNYTIITSKIRVRINIGVAYDADMLKAKQAVLGVAESTPWIESDPPPKVVVTAFGESSVDLQLRAWIGDARKRMDTISHITDKVKEAFDREGIEIPYPKRDINIITQK